MARCRAQTKSNKRCLNNAKYGVYCARHREHDFLNHASAVGLGTLAGNVLLPGIGGMILGGITGSAIRHLLKESDMKKKRVFVSFDYDNDRALKDFIIGQAKNPDSPFEVIDHSLKEAAPEKEWELKAVEAIEKCDIVLVIVGRETFKAKGVLKEVAMARKNNVKIVQIIGYSDGKYESVPGAGRLYAWNWENLKKILSS